MVKRAKTPETSEEAKYYTCWKPYPHNADFELSKDYIQFCRWIANILGHSDPLYAVYYKPRGNGMVIFSVDKTYPRPERLLGEHRWSEFLKKPRTDEDALVSRIYYCTYNTDREVQKDGWKCISVENFFFANWGIDKWFTKVPYPAPHWCNVPPENLADKSLCRPLPVALATILKPPQAPAPAPKPGSAQWAQVKQEVANNTQRNGAGRGWGNAPQQRAPIGGPATAKRQSGDTGWSPASFPSLESKPPIKKTIPGLAIAPTSTAQSVWGKRPSGTQSPSTDTPRPSPLSPPSTSTAHKVWADKRSSSPQKASPTVSPPLAPSPGPSQPTAPTIASTASPSPAPAANSTKSPTKASIATPPSTPTANSTKATLKAAPSPAPAANSTKEKNKAPAKPKVTTADVPKPAKNAKNNSPAKNTNPPPPSKNVNGKSKKWYSSSSSSESEGSSTASAVSSAPSSPSLASPATPFRSAGVHIDLNDYDYDDDYDEEITEETYHESESWETASVFQPPTSGKSPTVRLLPKGKGKTAAVAPKEEPTQEEEQPPNLWAALAPISRPTGSVSAAEAWANEKKELLCPVHKGKCKRGICEEYKKFVRKNKLEEKKKEKLERKRQRKEEKKQQKEDESKDKPAATLNNGKKSWADDDPNNPDSDIGEVPTFGKEGQAGESQTAETQAAQAQVDEKQTIGKQAEEERRAEEVLGKGASATIVLKTEETEETEGGQIPKDDAATPSSSNVGPVWDFGLDDSDSDISEATTHDDNAGGGSGKTFYDDEDYED